MTIPDMKPVESSNLAAVGYDEPTRALHVQFKSGGHYAYANVPPEAHKALMDAESKGSHFGKNILKKYDTAKVA